MKTIGFSRAYMDTKKFIIMEHFENGESRQVSEDYIGYKVWKGDIGVVSANLFVEIVDGKPRWVKDKNVILRDQGWAQVRTVRDALLKDCDWTQLADSKVGDEWREFRQTLRDIPQKYKTPEKALKALEDLDLPGGA